KESLANLRANLAEYNLSLDEIPWVLQFNKRDVPNVYSTAELNAELNPGGKVLSFEAIATKGKGVFETFRGVSHLLMEKVTRELRACDAAGTRSGGSPPGAERSAPRNRGGGRGHALTRRAGGPGHPQARRASGHSQDRHQARRRGLRVRPGRVPEPPPGRAEA